MARLAVAQAQRFTSAHHALPLGSSDFRMIVEGLSQRQREPARNPLADGTIIELHDGHDDLAGRRHKSFTGRVRLLNRKWTLVEGKALTLQDLHQHRSGDSAQDPALRGSSHDLAFS